MNSKLGLAVVVVMLILTLLGCGLRQEGKEAQDKIGAEQSVIAWIGSECVTVDEVKSELEALPPRSRIRYRTEEALKGLVDRIIERKLLALAAKEKNLDEDPEVKAQIERLTEHTLAQTYYKQNILDDATATEAEISIYYNENIDEFKEPERVEVFEILVASEEEAKEILTKLEAGGDFKELAKKSGTGTGRSARKNGYLGWIRKGRYHIPEIEEAAFKLTNPGSYSGIIEGKQGYHILMLQNRVEEKLKTQKEVANQIRQKLENDKRQFVYNETVQKLQGKYNVRVFKDKFAEIDSGSTSSKRRDKPIGKQNPEVGRIKRIKEKQDEKLKKEK